MKLLSTFLQCLQGEPNVCLNKFSEKNVVLSCHGVSINFVLFLSYIFWNNIAYKPLFLSLQQAGQETPTGSQARQENEGQKQNEIDSETSSSGKLRLRRSNDKHTKTRFPCRY